MSTYNKSSLLQSNNVLNLVMYNFFPCHGYMITLTMQLRYHWIEMQMLHIIKTKRKENRNIEEIYLLIKIN